MTCFPPSERLIVPSLPLAPGAGDRVQVTRGRWAARIPWRVDLSRGSRDDQVQGVPKGIRQYGHPVDVARLEDRARKNRVPVEAGAVASGEEAERDSCSPGEGLGRRARDRKTSLYCSARAVRSRRFRGSDPAWPDRAEGGRSQCSERPPPQ